MNVSSIARAGLLAETSRTNVVTEKSAQPNTDTAGVGQAVQQQTTASREPQQTRAPEQTAAVRYSSVLNEVSSKETPEREPPVFQNNATLAKQIAERVRINYDLNAA